MPQGGGDAYMLKHFSASAALLWALGSLSVFADDRLELAALVDEFLAGASVNDAAMHDRFWHDDLIYTSSSGARYGKQTILDGMDSSTATDEATAVYTADQVNIRLPAANVAVVTFRLVATGNDGAVDYFLNSGVFQRTNGVWQASTWQATRIPD